MNTTPSRSSKVKNHKKILNALFLNVILKIFQVKIKNQVILAQWKILKTFQVKIKNQRKILNTFQMKAKNHDDISNKGK